MTCASQLVRATVVTVLLSLLAAGGCTGNDQAANALVEYERSGGIAGFADRLEVGVLEWLTEHRSTDHRGTLGEVIFLVASIASVGFLRGAVMLLLTNRG